MGSAREESQRLRFERAFTAVAPLVLAEWPDLDRAAVEETRGDFEKLAALVAAHTERTKVSVRRQLLELLAIAEDEAPPSARKVLPVDDVVAAVRRLEAFAADEAKRMTGTVLPAAEARVRQSPWTSLLLALALGVIFGLWLGAGRRR